MPKLTLEESLAKNGFLTYRIRDEDILGVLTSFQHNGHTVSVSDWGYRLYSRGWVSFQPVRIFYKRVKGKLHR